MQPDNQSNQPYGVSTARQTTDQTPPAAPTVVNAPSKQGRSRKKLFAIIALAAIVLLGGSAAAYFGYYVPNKPENVLSSALENTLKQKQAQFNGNFDIESLDGNNPYAANIKMKGQGDMSTGNAETALDITVSGVKLALDAKVVDRAVYVKVGDLSGVKGLAAVALPGSEAIIDEANKKLADQWIEIDETLLKSAKADCAVELTKFTFSDQDIQLLQGKYEQNQFATIKSTGDEDVNGKGSIKYVLEIDNKKAEQYGDSLNDLSFVKKAQECAGEDVKDNKLTSEEGKTMITLWVEKDRKLINKLAFDTTPEVEKEENSKASLELTLDYEPVEITKPENARPLMEILGELESLSGAIQGGQMQSQ